MAALVLTARRRSLGGFDVGRVLPDAGRRMVGPFIFFDHMGPVTLPPDLPHSVDIRPHPHIGLATITYLFKGEIVHRDSLGVHQVIRPGEVNWMTAGRGISHSERFDTMRSRGGALDGIQAWVALPRAHEETDPAFVHFDAPALPTIERDGATLRVIAGTAFGLRSEVPTLSRLFYVHAEMSAGARCMISEEHGERGAFVVHGRVRVGDETIGAGQLIVLEGGSEPVLMAAERATVMLLGGEPVGERHIWWNFVSSSRERIEQAKADWREKRIPLPVGDDQEFIPLPDEPPPPPEPMS